MAANPLLGLADSLLTPVPFPGEAFLLRRDAVDCTLDSLESCGLPGLPNSVSFQRGRLFLSTVRLVWVPASPVGPLAAFDLPLLYVRNERFHQPIFGANYLAGALMRDKEAIC